MEVEDKALTYIAKAADGSMRDALSLLDQCIAFYLGQKLTYDHVLDVLGAVDTDVFGDLFRKICDQKLTDVVRELEQIILQGRELSQFVTDFIWYLRNLLMLKSDQNMEDVLDVSTERLAQMKKEADLTDTDTLMRYIRVLSELSGQLRYATQKRVLVELAMIKLCRPAMEQNYDSIFAEDPCAGTADGKRDSYDGSSGIRSGTVPAGDRVPQSGEAPKRSFIYRCADVCRPLSGTPQKDGWNAEPAVEGCGFARTAGWNRCADYSGKRTAGG